MTFDDARLAELKKYAFSVYILQALYFVMLITPVIGVIINYVKDEDVRGSWLESHCSVHSPSSCRKRTPKLPMFSPRIMLRSSSEVG